ncbi:MAG: hypothetical protein ACYCSF_07220 [Acidimicrobiales bacterium]
MSAVRRAGRLLAGGCSYLGLGLVAWWHVWTGGVAHSLTVNGYGDPAQQIWFLAWLPHALGTGVDPFVSHAMFAPAGINLMVNSSILFPAFVASPITVLFGPIVAFNVLVVLAPSASAFVAYLVFRRYTAFGFGAWLGGLFYGFSPFVLNDLADGHLHVTLLVFPPLVLLLLDDIVVSARGSPVRKGVLLGLVLAAQALTSLEVLAMIVIVGGIGIVVVALRHRAEIGARYQKVATGLGATAVTAGVLLAWPFEVLFFGPRRYKGSIFTSPESYVVWLKALVWPRGGPGTFPHLWASYLGVPLVVLVLLGAWRAQKPVVRLAVLLAAISLVFAMGRSVHLTPAIGTGIALPDRLITKAPFLRNLLPVRFMLVVDLLVALALAASLGAVAEWVAARYPGRSATGPLVAGTLGVLVLLSPALGARWPYPARQISVPAVYRSPVITGLAPGSVLLAYPVMNGFEADPMIWQAAEQLPYDMVAGYGFIPGGGPNPIGSLGKDPVTNLFGSAQLGLVGSSIPGAEARAVRRQIKAWKVSALVMLDTGRRPRDLVKVLTSLLRREPERVRGAWVWLGLRPPGLGS